MKRKAKKNNNFNKNQKFYFEDYLEANEMYKKKNNSRVSEDRVYLLFFLFFSLIFIFSLKITTLSLQKPKLLKFEKNNHNLITYRRDIVDRNGVLLSRNINSFHAAVRANLVKDKKKVYCKIKINITGP